MKRSHKYGSQIIHAMETGKPTVIYGNGALPSHLAALVQTDPNIQAMTRKREHIYHAAMLEAHRDWLPEYR